MQSSTDLHERLDRLGLEITEEDTQALRAAVLRRHRARRRQRHAVAVLAGSAAASVAVTALHLTGVIGSSDDASTVATRGTGVGADGDFTRLDVVPGEPCALARRVPVSEIASETDASIFMPDAADASSKNLSGSWLCGSTPALVFGPHLRILYETGWSDVDVESKFADLAKEYGGHISTVRAHPALFQAAVSDEAMSQVLLVSGDVLIRVLGSPSMPEEALLNIARSMDFSQPMR